MSGMDWGTQVFLGMSAGLARLKAILEERAGESKLATGLPASRKNCIQLNCLAVFNHNQIFFKISALTMK